MPSSVKPQPAASKSGAEPTAGRPTEPTTGEPGGGPSVATPILYGVAAVTAAAFAWAFWPTIVMMGEAWIREPDYSHGFLVIPLAAMFLWIRRDQFPGLAPTVAWPGLALLAACVGVRFASAYLFIEDLDGWSIIFWAASIAWLLGGKRMFVWALPAIGFLAFMVPLPYRVEGWLSRPLQSVATGLSSWTLQLLGQPALAEGNVILMGDDKLFVEEACSGMRIFVGIIALAYALGVLLKSPLWERLLLFASVPLVAIFANTARIVVIALTLHWLPESAGESVPQLVHDNAGVASIFFAAALFFGVIGYLRKAFPEEEVVDAASLIRRRTATA